MFRMLSNVLCAVALLLMTGSSPFPPRKAESTVQPDSTTTLYNVTIAASSPRDRTALSDLGFAIDAVQADQVVSAMTADELERAIALGLPIDSIQPLDFPPADAAFHNYDEMVAEIDDIAADHAGIVRVSSIGTSLEGRALLAVKISDEPDLDDPSEPAVLFLALTHAREHLTVEMALYVIRLFAGGYGSDPALTNLVNHREIWILPDVNPDGAEFDVETGYYRYWRKNLAFNADGSRGVDLNRNYGYAWGGQGASSSPSSETYRGPVAFSEPETQAVRDFVESHDDITTAISFHTYGEQILYPYGYTYNDLPSDMDEQDLQLFRALAGKMAAGNGYTPIQSSDLYLVSGDAVDWLYGARGIIAFTFEMFPKYSTPGFYPPAQTIEAETRRNDAAVRYITMLADHPEREIGGGGDMVAPEVSLNVSATLWDEGSEPLTVTVAATDAEGVTLLALQAGEDTMVLGEAITGTLTWTPPGPGEIPLVALGYDAAGNLGASDPITITARAIAMDPWRSYLPLVGAAQ